MGLFDQVVDCSRVPDHRPERAIDQVLTVLRLSLLVRVRLRVPEPDTSKGLHRRRWRIVLPKDGFLSELKSPPAHRELRKHSRCSTTMPASTQRQAQSCYLRNWE